VPVLALFVLALHAGPAPAAGLRSLTLAFSDSSVYTSSSASVRNLWLGRSAAIGAQVVRIDAGWPAASPPSDPTNPSDRAYDFTLLDAAVRDAAAHGLAPLLSFTGAPGWAEGPGRPASAPPGSWLPDPTAVGKYGRALAARYNGRFRDPLHPSSVLPKVTRFQLWNEPNLSQYLTPQWQHVNGRWIATGAAHYRLMLNAFYAGVKTSQPGAVVVSAGASPYGDFGHGARTMPVVFWTNVFSAPVSFTVLAHQPYALAAPSSPALDTNDVSVPDIGKLTKLLRSAERRGTALPRGSHHQVWVTETGYNTKPPNPTGVPVATDARWLEQSLYLFWAQGVSLATWYLIRDDPPGGTDTGVYFYGGTAKPAATAFRFPLVGHRVSGVVHAWLRTPTAGKLVVQAKQGGRWTTVHSATVVSAEVLDVAIPGSPQALRAAVAGVQSLTWAV
jgi:hypothetical protein